MRGTSAGAYGRFLAIMMPWRMGMPAASKSGSAATARLNLSTASRVTSVPGGASIHQVEPIYPPTEREEGRQGIVVLRLFIDSAGTVSRAQIVRSLGTAFDEAALAAVRQWSFEPALRDGEPVAAEFHVTINFVLDKARS